MIIIFVVDDSISIVDSPLKLTPLNKNKIKWNPPIFGLYPHLGKLFFHNA
jgi:hypothetical protein